DELGVEIPHPAAALLHRVGHDRPHVPQAGHLAHGIGDSARRRGVAQRAVAQRAGLPDPLGHRVVRCRRTNAASRRFLVAGTRTSTSSDDVPRMWWQRSAAGPVITLPLPAYSSAAISFWSVVGVPVRAI